MSSPAPAATARPAFPVALTAAVAIAFCVLVALGVWQVKRLAWKEALLARIAAAQHAAPRPLTSLAGLSRPEDFTRVVSDCAAAGAPSASAQVFRYAVFEGRLAWRLLGACRSALGPYDGVVVDRGVIVALTGQTSPSVFAAPAIQTVQGVIRPAGGKPLLGPAVMESSQGRLTLRVVDAASLDRAGRALGLSHPAPYLLAAERESPAPAGVTPQPLPTDIPNNHFVYALTWFGLAAVLIILYLQVLRSRPRGGR